MKEQTLQKIFPAFGTICTLVIYGAHDRETADIIRRRMSELHQLFSVFEPHSDISRINRSAGLQPVSVSADTLRLLLLALRYEKQTQGAFSILSGTSARLWKDAVYAHRMPAHAEIAETRNSGSLLVDKKAGTALLTCTKQQVDLGGIAKGYAADEARRILKKAKVRSALINFGGTVISIGPKRRIGIQNPFQKTSAPISEVAGRNIAVVTSGTYEQSCVCGGRRIHHIVNPRTGRPADSGLISVSLIGKHAAELDALATAACVLGEDQSRALLCRHNIQGIFISEDGTVHSTHRRTLQKKSDEALTYEYET